MPFNPKSNRMAPVSGMTTRQNRQQKRTQHHRGSRNWPPRPHTISTCNNRVNVNRDGPKVSKIRHVEITVLPEMLNEGPEEINLTPLGLKLTLKVQQTMGQPQGESRRNSTSIACSQTQSIVDCETFVPLQLDEKV